MSFGWRIFAVSTVLVLVPASSVLARPRPPRGLDLSDIFPNPSAIQDAADRVATAHCKTHECLAIVTINRVIDIVLEADVTPMNVPKLLPPNRDRVAESHWKNTVLHHPERFGAVCDTITGLASRYVGEMGNVIVGVSMIELAGRMDGKGGTCLASIRAAFPRNHAAETAIGNARIVCEGAIKPWAACERITR